MQHFIYQMKPIRLGMLKEGPTEQEQVILDNHVNYLAGLLEAGIILMAGRTLTADENTFGTVLFRADSQGQAHQIMSEDPVVKMGLMESTLYPYRIAMWTDKNPEEE
jgi:uncharacterized protein YciI